MIIQNKIFLRKKRNFSEMFNTVFALVRANFRVIAGALLMVGGPFILLTGVVTGILQSTVLRSIKDFSEAMFRDGVSQYLSDMISGYAGWFLVTWLFSLLAFSFIRATMANFFILYDSKSEGDDLTSAEIASKSFRDGFRIFGGVLLLSVVSFIPLAIIIGLVALLASTGGIAATVILIFVLVLLLLAFGPQLTYIFSFASWFAMLRDKVSIFRAIGNTFRTIRGNFWWIWVLMVCMFFIVSILNYVTSLPATIYYQVSIFTRSGLDGGDISYVYVLLFVIAQFGAHLFQCLGDLLVCVSYFSFEEERTGNGLQTRIDEIGLETEIKE